MKYSTLLALLLMPIIAFGQDTKQPETGAPAPLRTVSVSANGSDVRGIIHDLCLQANKSYVLQPGISFVLFLSLDKVDFEEALNIICAQAKLQYELQNGIYFIGKAKPVVAPAIPPAPRGILPAKVLQKYVSTKLMKTDIKAVFAAFGAQTNVAIEIDKSVPAFKLDAILTKITLKGALDKVTTATGLKYKFTNNLSILIFKPEDPNKVSISN